MVDERNQGESRTPFDDALDERNGTDDHMADAAATPPASAAGSHPPTGALADGAARWLRRWSSLPSLWRGVRRDMPTVSLVGLSMTAGALVVLLSSFTLRSIIGAPEPASPAFKAGRPTVVIQPLDAPLHDVIMPGTGRDEYPVPVAAEDAPAEDVSESAFPVADDPGSLDSETARQSTVADAVSRVDLPLQNLKFTAQGASADQQYAALRQVQEQQFAEQRRREDQQFTEQYQRAYQQFTERYQHASQTAGPEQGRLELQRSVVAQSMLFV